MTHTNAGQSFGLQRLREWWGGGEDVMRKVLVALMAIAIVVVGCHPASTPTPRPTRVAPSDEAYIL